MKHNVEITTLEGMMLRNAIWYYCHEASAHPIDVDALEKVSERIKGVIAGDLPREGER